MTEDIYHSNCQNCNKEFTKKRKEQNFCSTSCGAINSRKLRQKPRIFTHCITCNTELTRYDQKKFCSQSCAAKRNNIAIRRNKKKIVFGECLNCKEALIRRSQKRFCSRSCAGKYNFENNDPNKFKMGRPIKQVINRPVKYCIVCNKPTKRPRIPSIFCSSSCQANYNLADNINKFIDGQHVSTRRAKKYLFILFGHHCSKCKNEIWNEQPIPLEIEHINGDRSDNSLENICLLCPNCHAQTPTYKYKNAKNELGKEKRRKRYLKKLKFVS